MDCVLTLLLLGGVSGEGEWNKRCTNPLGSVPRHVKNSICPF